MLKLTGSHGFFTLRVWVRVNVYGRGFHLACEGSLAAMSQHVRSRGSAGEVKVSFGVQAEEKKSMIRQQNSAFFSEKVNWFGSSTLLF